jgi:hypothetical protein
MFYLNSFLHIFLLPPSTKPALRHIYSCSYWHGFYWLQLKGSLPFPLRKETDPVSEMCSLVFRILDDGLCPVILNVIQHCQYPLECNHQGHLCGLVDRVPDYRSRAPGSIPGATRFSEKYWAWQRVHSAS